MPVYAVGDIQGCYRELCDLLERIAFDAARDELWLVGDLVNRGPESLAVLRLVRSLGERATVVLGNHDLHLLAADAGARAPRPRDTFDDVLAAPERTELIDWLRTRPLVHHDPALGWTMVHAGLPPKWSVTQALARAAELESVLRGESWRDFLAHMYGDEPARWSEDLTGNDRLRHITNAFTRMRYCTGKGRLALDEDGPPGSQAPGLVPWFEARGRASRAERIVFGHWSTLGLAGAVDPTHRVFNLDSGCVWGGQLSALRLDDEGWFSVPSRHSGPARGRGDRG